MFYTHPAIWNLRTPAISLFISSGSSETPLEGLRQFSLNPKTSCFTFLDVILISACITGISRYPNWMYSPLSQLQFWDSVLWSGLWSELAATRREMASNLHLQSFRPAAFKSDVFSGSFWLYGGVLLQTISYFSKISWLCPFFVPLFQQCSMLHFELENISAAFSPLQ